MTEYLCLTLVARPAETEAAFKTRLAAFWTLLIRARPDDYARVYAEAARFGSAGGRITRQYMVEVEAVDLLLNDLTENALEFLEVERDDIYSKYEAASPDWFQIPH